MFESSVNSYDSQTFKINKITVISFESSVNSYDSQTDELSNSRSLSLRVV